MCFWASQGGAGQLVSSVTGTPPIVHTVHWAIESDQAHLPLFPVLTQLRHFLRPKVGGGVEFNQGTTCTAVLSQVFIMFWS